MKNSSGKPFQSSWFHTPPGGRMKSKISVFSHPPPPGEKFSVVLISVTPPPPLGMYEIRNSCFQSPLGHTKSISITPPL